MATANPSPDLPLPPPGERIDLIRASIRCFAWSLAGLVPLLGLPFAMAAMLSSHKLDAASQWNPAQRCVNAAGRIGLLGFLLSALVFLAVFFVLPNLDLACGRPGFGSG